PTFRAEPFPYRAARARGAELVRPRSYTQASPVGATAVPLDARRVKANARAVAQPLATDRTYPVDEGLPARTSLPEPRCPPRPGRRTRQDVGQFRHVPTET